MKKADFGITIEFKRGVDSPSRVFKTMTHLIESFSALDKDLLKTLDSSIEPVMLLEDIEAGSLRAWFVNQLNKADDSDLSKGDWKSVVGKYLIDAKYFLVDFLKDKNEISSKSEVKQITDGILERAKNTDVLRLPIYEPIPLPKVFSHLENITNALSNLSDNEKAILVVSDGKTAPFNMGFKISQEKLEEFLTKEIEKSKCTMILKIKKPDYLGDSRWDFRHGQSIFSAKIVDQIWLRDFQSRKIDVRPGDAIKAEVETETSYGYDGEVVSVKHFITKVLETIVALTEDQKLLL
ncbi:MAG TPA: hypothetical protein PK961_09155 [bacterium]|nr:hypothetical protein [bacterium]